MWPRVIGQERVKHLLLAARNAGRLPHAYLFYGEEGVGKDATALEFARVLRCEIGRDEACGSCPSCIRMATLQDPDVRFIIPLPRGLHEKESDEPMERLSEADVANVREQLRLKGENPYHRVSIPRANVIKINSIREIRRQSSLSTSGNGKRMFIISGAEGMNDEAANTLLKTLEEPPGETMLILTTAHREALLPTIVSRCQAIQFDPLTEDQLRDALIERNALDADKASLVARLARGSYTRALELQKEDVIQQRSAVVDFVRKALSRKSADMMDLIEEIADVGDRDDHLRFLELMLSWFRDALVLSHGGTVINLDQQDDLKRFVDRFPGADLLQVMADVEKAISLVNRYTYIRLVLANLAVRLRRNILSGT
jgi:DNA polymerase-3 subunit delta'